MTTDAPAIAVRGLRKSYGATVAVDGVSFDVARGECLGLLGPNGAGKSTTIHALVGALVPDAGTVRIDGDGDPADAATRRKIAESFVFALGDFHDTGWLRPGDSTVPVHPVLCFSERFLNVDTKPADLGTVYAPSALFAFHEYAHGCVDAFYTGNPAAQVVTGSVESEGE